MKNLSALLMLLLLLTTGVAAAGPGDQQKITARATTLTRQMARVTPLNEGQYVKVRQLNLRLLSEMQVVQSRFANDATALDQQLAEVQARYEWDLATILWPRQMVAYTQAKADLMAFGSR
ncbi:hypothetical protein [Hymenobacter sp. BT190]|uniref:hypothetical protein n=1 Tax=Hymenobacter sp. BT190 TaxID=2763505 RepID=UPI001651AE89|nr:hypothetical protein [Hymenobacter sp. BT190]MBC6698788.1 hypothetical protein [Hymenobacter sp. BT190]